MQLLLLEVLAGLRGFALRCSRDLLLAHGLEPEGFGVSDSEAYCCPLKGLFPTCP